MKRTTIFVCVMITTVISIYGLGRTTQPVAGSEGLLIAAASSMEQVLEKEVLPAFESIAPHLSVKAVYDSSGRLKTQIEYGLEADVFLSASLKQMQELVESRHVDCNSVASLLENQLVLIVPAGLNMKGISLSDIGQFEHIALGDPDSVPAGQYAKQALLSMHVWERVENKASFASSATQVLHWVSAASADAGFVYATDTIGNYTVEVAAIVSQELLSERIVYRVWSDRDDSRKYSRKNPNTPPSCVFSCCCRRYVESI